MSSPPWREEWPHWIADKRHIVLVNHQFRFEGIVAVRRIVGRVELHDV
jgi:hypothetical protein